MFCLILRFAKSRPVEESAVNKRSAYVPKAAFPYYGGQNPGITDFPVQEQAQATSS